MDIKLLKSKVESGTIDETFMIWVLEDEYSSIISDQYIYLICSKRHLNKKIIESLNEIPDESFIVDDNLYILKTDKWESDETHDNCIIICNKCKEGIKIPKLQEWQVIDYVLSKVKGLDKQDVEWLISLYNGNYFRFINDIEKISIFDIGTQKLIFNQMLNDGQFDDLTSLTIWDFSNSIIKKDMRMLKEVLKVIDYIDVSPLGLVTTLLNNFRGILNIQLNPKCTAKDVGMSDKQFFVVKKYNCGYYNRDQLIKIMKVLTNVEYMFKYNELPLSLLIDYLVCEILGA